MGSNSSSQATVNEAFSDITNMMSSTVESDVLSASSGCTTNENVNITIGTETAACSITTTQSDMVTCTSNSYLTSNNAANLRNDLSTAVTQAAKAAGTAAQELGSQPMSAANASSTINVADYIKTNIINKIDLSTLSSCASNSVINANNNYNIGYCAAPINIDSHTAMNAVANCVINALQTACTADTDLVTVIQQATATASATQTGLAALASSILNGIQGIVGSLAMAWVVIVIVVLVFFGLIAWTFLKIFQSPAGQKLANAAIDKAVSGSPMSLSKYF